MENGDEKAMTYSMHKLPRVVELRGAVSASLACLYAVLAIGTLSFGVPAMAQDGARVQPEVIPLWDRDVPLALGDAEKDIPDLIAYIPQSTAKAKQGAIVILPGGGYGGLAIDHEGHQIARWANKMGLAGIIVRYRHRGRGYGHPVPMLDAQRAIRLVRSRAAEWQIDPTKVGIMGFSAGGHLATTTLTKFDSGKTADSDRVEQESCRPDFGIVCYAVVAMGESFTHAGSQRNLLGKEATPELIKFMSNEKQVRPDTPPCFIWHTAEDRVVPAENSLRFYSALVQEQVPAELHVFSKGRHGIGLGASVEGASQWPLLCERWLVRNSFGRVVREEKLKSQGH
ncbi:MAG: alpha/beta hydrolase [Planctomycetota bacterium]